MDRAVALVTPLEAIGPLVAAALAALAVLAPSVPWRARAMGGALVLTPLLLLGRVWGTEQFEPLRDDPALALAGGTVAVLAVGALARVLAARPAAFPVLVVLALPLRVPIESGGATSNLLVPLYLVIAAGALAWLVPRLRERVPGAHSGPGSLEWLLLGAVVLYALQAIYSSDFDRALEQVVFFYVPFALLFALLREVEWSRPLALRCLGALVALALGFAAVGFWEYQARELLLNPQVIASNQFESYFRVNSLFFDPNIYGRFLAVVMLALAVVLLGARRPRELWLTGAALAVLWAGLVLTFSQSSFSALLAGLAVLAALRWRLLRAAALAAALALAALALVVASPGTVGIDPGRDGSLNDATSGRLELIEGGLEVFASRPLLGHGAGSFQREYRRARHSSSARAVSASHTIAVTVAAEQGVLGLALYLALVLVALRELWRGARADPVRAWLAAAFVALVVHTQLYAAFLEDPLVWALLGIGAALAVPRRAPAPAPAP